MTASITDTGQVNARIVYWGIAGSGLSSNLQFIYAKLRSDHRGELRKLPTRLDPTVTYELLPISLGEVNGVSTQLEITAVPGEPDLVHTRKQLLDEVDGVVLVLDSQPQCAEANLESLEELRKSLADYGRSIEDVPLVVQYNKRDLADAFQIEDLHRRLGPLGLADSAVFEAVASEGRGVLKALTTISKQVVRTLRERRDAEDSPELAEPVPVYQPDALARKAVESAEGATPAVGREHTEPLSSIAPTPAIDLEAAAAPIPATRQPAFSESVTQLSGSSHGLLEQAILAEDSDPAGANDASLAASAAQSVLDQPWDKLENEIAKAPADWKIVSVGTASQAGERTVKIPLVLGNDDGQSVTLGLTLRLDPLVDS